MSRFMVKGAMIIDIDAPVGREDEIVLLDLEGLVDKLNEQEAEIDRLTELYEECLEAGS